jgi:monothiol glutaredoxin
MSDSTPAVRQITVEELKEMRDAGIPMELVDVRTPEERAIAGIDGAALLDDDALARLYALPQDTLLVFHCHHGFRSLDAAQHFRSRGFVNLCNVTGGIDAWSMRIDPTVPRY